MMKMTGGVACCCVALLFAVASVSASVKKLKSIKDLKKIDFGRSVPAHSLVLLHWFANTIDIDLNNRIRLTFDPSNGDYGTHHYGNYERLLDPLPRGHQYYTVGNLNLGSSIRLPDHVVHPQTSLDGGNRDRIVFRVCGERIDQVYLTQHRGQNYDPDHTYQITTNLLRQIQEFSLSGDYQTLVDLRNRYGGYIDESTNENNWGHLAFLQLFLCIVMSKTVHIQGQRRRSERRQNPELNQNRGSGSDHNNSESWTDNQYNHTALVVREINRNRGSGTNYNSESCIDNKCRY
ncbi:uncharacterized protein LOC141809317 [Halichoeres trimaculatus]|uniref:uncharacterized protein LOC141809317 n=1 Tax=Halichoeres trimaculatus TaxID=147232 RepID=UPI003D9DDE8E